MKYRRRRRRSSYGRRKSHDVIVLSDAEEPKNEQTKETEDKPTNEEETVVENEGGTTGMEVHKDDPIHEPDAEESPVIVQSSDPPEVFNEDAVSNTTLNQINVQESYGDNSSGNDERSQVTQR